MFCPDCGAENARNQKFCNRCGSNLVVLEQARSIVAEVATSQSQNTISSGTVLRMVALISILGLMFITGGTIALSVIQGDIHNGPPIGLFFGMSGLAVLFLIVRRLLNLIHKAPSQVAPLLARAANLHKTTPVVPASNTQALPEAGSPGYYSVTEERTKQFER